MDSYSDYQRAHEHSPFLMHIAQRTAPPRSSSTTNKLLGTHLDVHFDKLDI